MKATLIRLDAPDPEKHAVQDRFPLTIGRDCAADIQLADPWVSRMHCEIDEVDGVLVVRDLDSRHGTYVNGRRIHQILLMPGNRLGVGLTHFLVSYQHNANGGARAGAAYVLEERSR